MFIKFCCGISELLEICLRQNVRWDSVAQRASWFITDLFKSINSTRRTRRNFAVFVQYDVIGKIIWKVDSVAIGQVMFQSILIRGSINLAKVVDAGIGRTGA